MLALKAISKHYKTATFDQVALKEISLQFRKNEFVSILGPSGSGKTTLLNIIGGLDRYSSGDLIIEGKSTKEYTDRDWDRYRNNSIGFIFQRYQLISHQSVLANVELALTLAGVSAQERKTRAKDALSRVGLEDHIHKKPNQLSGGQMQRVAIARALVNNPAILLADEPTGALDTETSLQIMDLLMEIARDRLVIMVTHNPELADRYSTRIIRLLDGEVISDSNPYLPESDQGSKEESAGGTGRRGKSAMSFFTALSLSFNNLVSKKGRTILTALAGSIGIIGIALILSLSTGIQDYMDQVQEETLTSYPIQISDRDDPLQAFLSGRKEKDPDRERDKVYANSMMERMFKAGFSRSKNKNLLSDFKKALEQDRSAEGEIADAVSIVQYRYPMPLNFYVKEDPDIEGVDEDYRSSKLDEAFDRPDGMENRSQALEYPVFVELLPDERGEGISDLVSSQYELVKGKWPEGKDELVLVLDKRNEIPDLGFYAMGLIGKKEIRSMMTGSGEEPAEWSTGEVDYDKVLSLTFKLLLNKDFYARNPDGTWRNIRREKKSFQLAIENGMDVKIVGIVRLKEEAKAEAINGIFAYHPDLTAFLMEETKSADIVKEQLADRNRDIFSGLPFEEEKVTSQGEKAEAFLAHIESLDEQGKSRLYREILSTPSEEVYQEAEDRFLKEYPDRESLVGLAAKAFDLDKDQARDYLDGYEDAEIKEMMAGMVKDRVKEVYEEQAIGQIVQIKAQAPGGDPYSPEGDKLVAAAFDSYMAKIQEDEALADLYDLHMPSKSSDGGIEDNLDLLAYADEGSPAQINLYARSFADKEAIDRYIQAYNTGLEEDDQIRYTDYAGLIMSGVTTMINAITYGLIAFVSISLVVSSIMIGIITYISVLERTREIGILRSIGASKKDIARVFNAETLIIGFFSGLLGILVTLALNIPISNLIYRLTEIERIAVLPVQAGLILIGLSMILTLLAGIIPSRMAAKKDPVEALRMD